ncbi:MAG: hypothetical protein ACTSRP_22325, partial [Candidatus Helarchaeota archaeon]
MGGFRTVFGGLTALFAGVIAIVVGLVSPSYAGVPNEHLLLGYIFARWNEATAAMSTNQLFGIMWIVSNIVWIICAILLTIGAIVGFWKGGYSALIGAILFLVFDILLNVIATT